MKKQELPVDKPLFIVNKMSLRTTSPNISLFLTYQKEKEICSQTLILCNFIIISFRLSNSFSKFAPWI